MFKLLAIFSTLLVGPQEPTYVKIYDIKDLECMVPEFAVSVRLDLRSALEHNPQIIAAQPDTVNRERFDSQSFIDLMKAIVDPENEGPTNITYWKGSLIVNTTDSIHKTIK